MFKAVLFFLIPLLIGPAQAAESLLVDDLKTPTVFINQIMIGQEAAARNEFIELYNPGSETIDLKGYSLKKKTKSGTESNLVSSKNFSGLILPNSYFLISSPEFCDIIFCDLIYSTSASLSSSNTILLYDADKKVSDKVAYGQAQDFYQEPAPELQANESLVRKQIITGGKNNRLDFVKQTQNIIVHNSLSQEISIPINEKENKDNTSGKQEKTTTFLNLWDIYFAKNNENISTEGIVSVLPGALGSQYFYIHLGHSTDKVVYGLQIYNFQKKFPNLEVGDYVKINGVLSVSQICPEGFNDCPNNSNFYRLKTKEINDIKILSFNNNLKIPDVEKIHNLNWNQVSQLKTISGKITQNKTNSIYLDDGEKEILIEIKKGTQISSKVLAENLNFTISGILNYNTKELKLTLISSDDIIGEETKYTESLGVILNDDFWEMEKEKKKNDFFLYILIIVSGTIIYIIWLKKLNKK